MKFEITRKKETSVILKLPFAKAPADIAHDVISKDPGNENAPYRPWGSEDMPWFVVSCLRSIIGG
jgi:hypothetical protein